MVQDIINDHMLSARNLIVVCERNISSHEATSLLGEAIAALQKAETYDEITELARTLSEASDYAWEVLSKTATEQDIRLATGIMDQMNGIEMRLHRLYSLVGG